MTTRQAMKTHVKSFPAPARLATVTDLMPQEAQAVTEAVNPLIADALEEILDETERRTWFLFEVLQGVNTAD